MSMDDALIDQVLADNMDCSNCTTPDVMNIDDKFAWIGGHGVPEAYKGNHRKYLSHEQTEVMIEELNDGMDESEVLENYSEYFAVKDDEYYKWKDAQRRGLLDLLVLDPGVHREGTRSAGGASSKSNHVTYLDRILQLQRIPGKHELIYFSENKQGQICRDGDRVGVPALGRVDVCVVDVCLELAKHVAFERENTAASTNKTTRNETLQIGDRVVTRFESASSFWNGIIE
ncbi:hypothetical protein V1506DRAFT_506703 [Lipomyces tetrasporus]